MIVATLILTCIFVCVRAQVHAPLVGSLPGPHQPNTCAKGQSRTCHIYIYIYLYIHICYHLPFVKKFRRDRCVALAARSAVNAKQQRLLATRVSLMLAAHGLEHLDVPFVDEQGAVPPPGLVNRVVNICQELGIFYYIF